MRAHVLPRTKGFLCNRTTVYKMRAHVLPRTKGFLCNRTTAYKMRAHVLPRDMGVGGEGGGEPQKGPPQDKKGHPSKKFKKCAITVFRGLGGMVPREKFNYGAPYYNLNASQQGHIYDFLFFGRGG